jgi:hypothetical protein
MLRARRKRPGEQIGSRLDGDPDQRMLRWGWIVWGAWTLVGGVRLWRDLDSGDASSAAGLLLLVPAWGLWLLWLLWRGSLALRSAIRLQNHAAWHGRYYAFNDRQIRVHFDEGVIRVPLTDLLLALDLPASAADGDTWLDETVLHEWLRAHPSREAARFAHWFNAEVAAPYRRRRGEAALSAADVTRQR